MADPTRWATEKGPAHSKWYVDRFRSLAEEGADLAGEARLVDAMLPRHARVLDAGCGPGRVGAELAARGHRVVGLDADPILIEAAHVDHPGARWLVADLAELDLASSGETEPFDAAVLAGNVLAFVAPGTEVQVLAGVARHLRADGFVIVGFGVDRGYSVSDFDEHVASADLLVEQRFATWDLQPWTPQSAFCVTVLRRPRSS
jgi:SAM-dependent methyltransferase